MAAHSHNKVSSIKSILKTVATDRQTYLWFKNILFAAEIKQPLVDGQAAGPLYGKFNFAQLCQNLSVIICISLTSLFLLTHRYILLFIAFFLCCWAWRAEFSKKEYIQKLAQLLLTKDFPAPELEQKTLYQITEHYSRKWNYPSFVTFIYKIDQASRTLLVLAFIIFLFVYPLGGSPWFIPAILGAFGCAQLFMSSFWFFKSLKDSDVK